MSKYFLFLQTVHNSVHDFNSISIKKKIMKEKFTIPKIFSGGVSIDNWKKLTKSLQKDALEKDWYVYYSFRDNTTGKLKRMPNVKGGVNRLKTMEERMSYLTTMKDALLFLLEKGLNPYEDNDLNNLLANTSNDTEPDKIIPTSKINKIQENKIEDNDKSMQIKDAFEFALKMKKNVLSETSYKNFELRIRKFKVTLDTSKSINSITKKTINEYLNDVLEKSSARNRNNTRTDLGTLFQILEDNDIIPENFIRKTSVLNSKPERNKTYTPDLQESIFEHLKQNDPILLLFIKFVCYNFLRPVEVCRLKIKDIDIKDKKVYLKAKNKAVKIKIIPDILIDDLPDLSNLNPENLLFTPNGFGLEWVATENNRRDNFSKRFKEVVKDHFNLGIDYGMYSFRHTFITKLYRKLRLEKSQFEAKSILMLITGHSTMTALEQYLRDIDAELPQDYSDLIK